MNLWKKVAIIAAIVLAVGLVPYFIFFYAKENDPKMMEKLQIEKIATPAHTASVGGEITYRVLITNENYKRVKVLISDVLPADATLVSGDFEQKEGRLEASLAVGPKKTKSVSYTVRIGDSYAEGDVVSAPGASIGEKKSGAVENFVGRTLNAAEKARMREGILALM